MSNFITIKDIARELKISVATVSRALRDTYDVNKETRDKVLEMAQRLNYRPNINATGLARGKTFNIGVILPFIANYYFSTVITGIQEIAYSKGYNIILFITNDSAEREVVITQNLSVSSFVGFLVSTCASTYEHFNTITDSGIPIVFFDRVSRTINASKVMQDDYNGAYEATEHLIRQGYVKIAHLAGPKDITMTERRLKGYLDALDKHGIPVKQEYIFNSGFSQECGETDTGELLELADRPDAIFAVNDRKAIGAMITLKNRGIQIGKDMGVMGFTNDPMSSIISPSLSTMAEPAFDIGRISCELLLKHIDNLWRLRENAHRNGNLYPTHGLGPVCQIMNINRGDKMEYLVSVSSNDFTLGEMAKEAAAKDKDFEPFVGSPFIGNMNTSTIRTNLGKTILVQHDISSPRPYSRIHQITGTKAMAVKYPLPARIATGHEDWVSDLMMKQYEQEYTLPIVTRLGEMAKQVGGHGEMDFLMDWRLIDCLRNGLPMDHDVYDAALWSSIAPLSEWSVAHRSSTIDVPDFTRGSWKNNKPVDMSIAHANLTNAK